MIRGQQQVVVVVVVVLAAADTHSKPFHYRRIAQLHRLQAARCAIPLAKTPALLDTDDAVAVVVDNALAATSVKLIYYNYDLL